MPSHNQGIPNLNSCHLGDVQNTRCGCSFVFGLLNLNKPTGLTSREVVNQIQRLVRPHKIGHAGTLDPIASGVLVLLLGPATRLTKFVQVMPKRYLATFQLGCESETDDIEGYVRTLDNAIAPSQQQLHSALPSFLGEILQRPPKYSAIKVKGKRAYELARQGKQINLPARPVQIYELQIARYDYPYLELSIACGSGTYVRSLGRDLAQSLNTSAVMTSLVRQSIGDFHLEESVGPNEITLQSIAACVLPPQRAIAQLDSVCLSELESRAIRNGQTITIAPSTATEEIAATDSAGNLLAILVQRGNQWGPVCNFVS